MNPRNQILEAEEQTSNFLRDSFSEMTLSSSYSDSEKVDSEETTEEYPSLAEPADIDGKMFLSDSDDFSTSDATDEFYLSDVPEDVPETVITIQDEATLQWNRAIYSQAKKLFQEGDRQFELGDYCHANDSYKAAIALVNSIPENERTVKEYRLLDECYNNLATSYHRLDEYALEREAYLNAYATLNCVRTEVDEQDDVFWMADYSLSAALASRDMGEMPQDYNYLIENGINLLVNTRDTVPLRTKDLFLLTRCYLELNNHEAVLRTLNEIDDKNDDYYRLAAKCKEAIALAIDPLDQPVSEQSVKSAKLLLSSLVDRYKIDDKRGADQQSLVRLEVQLNERLEDLNQFILESKEPTAEVETTVVSVSRVTLFGRPASPRPCDPLYQQSATPEHLAPTHQL